MKLKQDLNVYYVKNILWWLYCTVQELFPNVNLIYFQSKFNISAGWNFFATPTVNEQLMVLGGGDLEKNCFINRKIMACDNKLPLWILSMCYIECKRCNNAFHICRSEFIIISRWMLKTFKANSKLTWSLLCVSHKRMCSLYNISTRRFNKYLVAGEEDGGKSRFLCSSKKKTKIEPGLLYLYL